MYPLSRICLVYLHDNDTNLFNEDISGWDVSNVTNMESMFSGSLFNQPLNGWVVSNVENMESMFSRSEFNQPLNGWDVSNVENMESMFSESKFNQDISQWNVGNVVHMTEMFFDSDFNNGGYPERLENWNIDLDYLTRGSTNDMFSGTLIEAGDQMMWGYRAKLVCRKFP